MLGGRKIGYFIAIRLPLPLFLFCRGFGLRFTVQDDRLGFGLGSGDESIEASSLGSGC